MDPLFDLPWLSDQAFREHARDFLQKYHPTHTIPVPIEEIVEIKLRLNVVPTPGLHEHFDIDGLLANTLDTIWVDRFFFDKRLARHRFTLAHEVAHLLLHADIYRSAPSTISEWREFIRSIPEAMYSRLEYKANCVAGLILMPSDHLRKETEASIRLVEGEGINLQEHWDFAWNCIAGHLAERFFVSSAAARAALSAQGVEEAYRNRT